MERLGVEQRPTCSSSRAWASRCSAATGMQLSKSPCMQAQCVIERQSKARICSSWRMQSCHSSIGIELGTCCQILLGLMVDAVRFSIQTGDCCALEQFVHDREIQDIILQGDLKFAKAIRLKSKESSEMAHLEYGKMMWPPTQSDTSFNLKTILVTTPNAEPAPHMAQYSSV